MSTHAVIIIEEDKKPICGIYIQSDGYLSGVGATLVAFCDSKRIVNGLSGERAEVANGMGCLAAQLVAHLKNGPGGCYLISPKAISWYHEYKYVIKMQGELKGFGKSTKAVVYYEEKPLTLERIKEEEES